jgi:hypothetical protein
MLYNDNISYNQLEFTFFGDLLVKIPGISSPLTLNSIAIAYENKEDNSNSTVTGFITIMSAAQASISMEFLSN